MSDGKRCTLLSIADRPRPLASSGRVSAQSVRQKVGNRNTVPIYIDRNAAAEPDIVVNHTSGETRGIRNTIR